jgi:hypothetical protein
VSTLCFVDTETTGLDPRIHQPYEVCIWRDGWNEPNTYALPHTLEHADPQALKVGGYFERECMYRNGDQTTARVLTKHLRGVTLVGSNPAFDAAMLTRIIGTPVWHHRMLDVAQGAMWVFDWHRPKGLADVALALRRRGYEIPEPDHTAEGDVRTARAVYGALRDLRCDWPPLTEGPERA